MKPKKRKLLDLLMLFLLLSGIGILAYPFVSDALNNYLDQQIISHYQQQAVKENEEVMAKIQENMTKKNQQLAKEGGNSGADPFTKKKEPVKKDRTYFEKHTIGILTIPKINVNLPIFDQTTMKLLEKGACLLEGTSYPIGGKSTHAVLSSHRGLSQAKLFTNLPQLKIKDHFYIEINGQYLAYQVDQIKTVEPTETEALQIQEDQDLVTLVTCTPYMINSHRLLVRGHRIVVEPEEIKESLEKVKQAKCTAFLLVSGLISVLLLLFLVILIKFLKK
ncbi:class C sortase [Enterococcus faecium]|uniref:class C sortase n=3 Tax=Enterococcus faecium TaxID=1352 RepID=UPI0002AF352D|nr:class C sortase [Enterococcus faecium]AGE29408.1 Sortase A, LPXTG specific [Enterococcus faecium ATCC 8459 = NRRL B-2354]EGP4891479.1 class C sortase [Enterococcus faecium]EHU4999870.1 class C sortase [Enterococcus faecium]EME3573825.1 class C sortase [Enterococcus faecium]EME8069647.1 class C sortase [Enterococcus faecium]